MYHPRLKESHYDMGFPYGKILVSNGININDAISLTKEQRAFAKDA